MIIISLDAVGRKDISFLRALPNFRALYNKSGVCEHVKSVYPSLTYPAHTSIITGRLPKNHGIINNTLLQPMRKTPDWMWQRKRIKSTTLYDEAHKKGMTTAALLWPVTAKSNITWNFPEIFANRPWQNQIVVSVLNGSARYQIDLYKRFGRLLNPNRRTRQPSLDNFVQASLLYTLKKYQPDLTLVHFTDVDTHRHIYGVEHEKVREALKRHDKRLGEIIHTLEETGTKEQTTIVVLGDHYQQDVHTIVYLNYLLKEKGYLKTNGNKITSYQALAKNCDGSCYIYFHEKYKHDTILTQEMTGLLKKIRRDSQYGIKHVFTGEEAGRIGADDTCAFMLEAKAGYYFLDEFKVLTQRVEDEKKYKMRAVHGYLPTDENYETFFMASGYGVSGHKIIPQMTLWDEGVTLAKLLGVHLGEVDGRAMPL